MGRRYVMGKRLSESHDSGSPERWQHGGHELVLTGPEGSVALRALQECALDRWLALGAITAPEHEAGLALRRDYVVGRVSLYAQRSYDGVRGPTPGAAWQSPGERRGDVAEAAYQRWRAAIRAVGLRAGQVLIAVCCEDGVLAWSQRESLRAGLQALIVHYH